MTSQQATNIAEKIIEPIPCSLSCASDRPNDNEDYFPCNCGAEQETNEKRNLIIQILLQTDREAVERTGAELREVIKKLEVSKGNWEDFLVDTKTFILDSFDSRLSELKEGK